MFSRSLTLMNRFSVNLLLPGQHIYNLRPLSTVPVCGRSCASFRKRVMERSESSVLFTVKDGFNKTLNSKIINLTMNTYFDKTQTPDLSSYMYCMVLHIHTSYNVHVISDGLNI